LLIFDEQLSYTGMQHFAYFKVPRFRFWEFSSNRPWYCVAYSILLLPSWSWQNILF